MLKGKSSYQMGALSQASASSHVLIISRPGRDVVTCMPSRQAAPGYDPIEQRPARHPRLFLSYDISNPNDDHSGPSMATQTHGEVRTRTRLRVTKSIRHRVLRDRSHTGLAPRIVRPQRPLFLLDTISSASCRFAHSVCPPRIEPGERSCSRLRQHGRRNSEGGAIHAI
jgi:hypothetical protein